MTTDSGRRLRVVFFGSAPSTPCPPCGSSSPPRTSRWLRSSVSRTGPGDAPGRPHRPRCRRRRVRRGSTLTPEQESAARRPNVCGRCSPTSACWRHQAIFLPTHLLEAFPHGVLNVHASLLPKFRGASPVAAAILAGEEVTGASIVLVVRELDAGPVVGTVTTEIGPLTTGTLTTRIAELGALRMLELLPAWVTGEVEAKPQDEALASYAPRLARAGRCPGLESTRRGARPASARVPALAARDHLVSRRVADRARSMASARAVRGASRHRAGRKRSRSDGAAAGQTVGSAVVACGEGGLALLRVQRAGRRPLDIEDTCVGILASISTSRLIA